MSSTKFNVLLPEDWSPKKAEDLAKALNVTIGIHREGPRTAIFTLYKDLTDEIRDKIKSAGIEIRGNPI